MLAGTFRKPLHVGLNLKITILYSHDFFMTYSLIFLKDINKSIDKDTIYNGLKIRYFSKVVFPGEFKTGILGVRTKQGYDSVIYPIG